MGTRPHFRRLANQGHVILDIAYSLVPEVDLIGMVGDVKRGVLWLKQNGPRLGVDPDRVVLMGGSAGGHLALLAAYTPNHRQFQPVNSENDTGVRGVVAFYPPTDLNASYESIEAARHAFLAGRRDKLSKKAVEIILQTSGFMPTGAKVEEVENLMARMLGVTPAEDPDRYRLLSPLHHVNSHCPPTLLLQSAADTFAMVSDVRRLHEALRQAGVPSILVEFPDTDHAFDLYMPQISPPAQAAMYDMERFLALLV
jgi:acetyl esterase/lipase